MKINKLLIVIIMILICGVSTQAKADTIILNPTQVKLHYLDPNSGADSYLQFNQPFQQANWGEYGTYDMITTYNDPYRMKDLQIWGGEWPGTTDAGNIIEFKTAIYWYAPNSETRQLYVNYANWWSTIPGEEENAQNKCAQVNQQYMDNDGTRVLIQSWKCYTNKRLDKIVLGFGTELWTTSINQVSLMISHDFIFRDPVSEEEVQDILQAEFRAIIDNGIHGNPSQFVDGLNNGSWYTPGLSNVWNLATKDVEEDLWWYMREEDWNNKGVSIDTNASSWIWEKANTILHTNTYVWGLYLSALGVCLIRLVLG